MEPWKDAPVMEAYFFSRIVVVLVVLAERSASSILTV
ncbi:MAG: hypothetical protein ACJAZ9_002097 [Neolewinella sp.]